MGKEHFYVKPSNIGRSVLVIDGEEHKHLSRVLRKQVGDHIVVIDGRGHSYEVMIRSVDGEHTECEIIETREMLNESPVEVAIGVSLLRNPSRFDFMVEKVTELGVRRIIPLLCERTIPQHAKLSRYQKIALSATKQSCRSVLPEIFVLTKFDVLLQGLSGYDLKLIPHETTEQSQFLGTVLQHHITAQSIFILIGPEGGFSDSEIGHAAARGFVPVSLGPRRLRAETAAILSAGLVLRGR
ncbi:MAG: 16S rRNA (uracil(1498)-N(3))-methyltransferase [Ignavibacteria bacterium]|nr:16S rRNA (uracil(1498)-N(3))-methyltransferase [Ignavibacteria bacterium]